MPAISGEIPLLTIPAVLFPGTFLPLQVTEESQRTLLRSCIDKGHSVGVVLMQENNTGAKSAVPYTTGCLASIALLAYENDEYSDEPLNAVLYGERRINVREFVQQDPYLTGQIESYEDYDGIHAQRRVAQAAKFFQQYLDLIHEFYGTDVINISLPGDPTMASYVLASVLYLPMSVKQRWLESPSTAYRLEQEITYLQAECEKHEILLALSEQLQHRYTMPDPHLYLSLVSQN